MNNEVRSIPQASNSSLPQPTRPSQPQAGLYHIWTIGCQMNVADSNHVASELEKIGYQPTENIDQADVVVLNTCVVRQSAENKAIGKLGSLKPWRQSQPTRTLALMGCMVGVKPSQKLIDAYPDVDVFMPPSEASPLVNHLQRTSISDEMRAFELELDDARHKLQDGEQSNGGGQSIKHLALSGEAPVAAYVPVVYGCSHACTFCIIPFRRGIERSRPVNEIVAEVQGLVDQGVREIMLLGQIVDRYGYDWRGQLGNSATVDAYTAQHAASEDAYDLADLLHALHDINDLWRIRFLTSHPNYMTDRILDAVRTLPKVCEHIEVPIQAGDDEVLSNMKRGYTRREYYQLVERIRNRIPDVAIHTDVIVGFCGETEQQFAKTVQVVNDLRFDKIHMARYSPRAGTVSERKMADDVPELEKRRRHQKLEAMQETISAEINATYRDQVVEVLVESEHKGKWRGRTRQNKLVFIDSELPLRGRLVEARVTWTGPWSMQARFECDVSPTGNRIRNHKKPAAHEFIALQS